MKVSELTGENQDQERDVRHLASEQGSKEAIAILKNAPSLVQLLSGKGEHPAETEGQVVTVTRIVGTADLLPCPFCGGMAEWSYTEWDEETKTGDDGMGVLECTGCHVQIHDDRDSAETLWNRRVEIFHET